MSNVYTVYKDVNLFIVEDDEVDVRAIKRALEKQHVANPMFTARDGVEALQILRGQDGHEKLPHPCLIMLDLNMPRMNGIAFLRALRADPELADSIVFVLTTSNSEEDRTAAYKEHVAGYLLKSKAKTGEDLFKVVKMVEAFVLVVQFPPEHG